MVLFKFFGLLIFLLGIFNAILSFVAKGILKSNGYEISYLITQPIYEIKVLKELSKENPTNRTIFLLYKSKGGKYSYLLRVNSPQN